MVAETSPAGGDREFLVRIAIDVADIPSDRRSSVLADERVRGREMRSLGHIQRIWRAPQPGSSISVWRADDELHLGGLLDALPIAPWANFDVTPIEPHPLELEVLDAD
jgi:muconolactone D-isomerase